MRELTKATKRQQCQVQLKQEPALLLRLVQRVPNMALPATFRTIHVKSCDFHLCSHISECCKRSLSRVQMVVGVVAPGWEMTGSVCHNACWSEQSDLFETIHTDTEKYKITVNHVDNEVPTRLKAKMTKCCEVARVLV